MKIWKVGDKATTVGGECTIMAVNQEEAAVQYTKTQTILVVELCELRPNFSMGDKKAIEEIFQIIVKEQDYRNAAESLYLEGYRKQEKDHPSEDMTDPANWKVGDSIECIDQDEPYITFGLFYYIEDNSEGVIGIIDDGGDLEYYLPTKFTFVTRGGDA